MYRERFKKIYLLRYTLWDMALKQLKIKYAGSRLGIWWAIVTPLVLALSINFVFSSVFKIQIPHYTIFVLSGLMPWIFFTSALDEAARSFVVNSSVLRQGIFPREFIPIASILANLFNFLIGFVFLLPLFIVLNVKIIGFLVFLFPTIIFYFFFTLGFGLLLSTVNIFFRDLSHFLSILFMVWFWITPVFYSVDMLPANFRWICTFNPMSYFITLYQNVLFTAKVPEFSMFLIVFFFALFSFIGGYFIFLKKESLLAKII